MQMSLPIRRNHIGKIWTSPLLSSVAKFAMRILERISISVAKVGGTSCRCIRHSSYLPFSTQ